MTPTFSIRNVMKTRLHRFLMPVMFALLFAPLLAFAASGAGSVQNGYFKSQSDIITNTTDDYKTALSAQVTLDSSGDGCILVRFTANLFVYDLGDPDSIAPAAEIKAVVSGQPMKPGTLLYTDTDDVLYSNFAGEWWRCGLAGNGTVHTVKIKYRRRLPQAPGDTVQIRERTMTVQLD